MYAGTMYADITFIQVERVSGLEDRVSHTINIMCIFPNISSLRQALQQLSEKKPPTASAYALDRSLYPHV
jgi:hypothetical protein